MRLIPLILEVRFGDDLLLRRKIMLLSGRVIV